MKFHPVFPFTRFAKEIPKYINNNAQPILVRNEKGEIFPCKVEKIYDNALLTTITKVKYVKENIVIEKVEEK